MDIVEATQLAEDYLDAEYAALSAVLAEPDDAVVTAAVAAAARFLRPTPDEPPLVFIMNRPAGVLPDVLAKTTEQLANYQRRALFQVKAYQHPVWGALFAAYAGSRAKASAGAYERLLYFADVDGAPGLVAEYIPELLAPAPPVTWSHLQGARIDDPGELMAVRQLSEPTRKAHLADYQSAAPA